MDIATYLETSGLKQHEFALKIGVTQARVSHWINGARVPSERCIAIETATGGAVTRYDLRPDVFGQAPDPQPVEKAA